MLSNIGLVIAAIGVIYLIVSAILPVLGASRTDPYTAYTGGAAAAAATAYVSPVERLIGGIVPQGYRRRVDYGADFRWGRFLDRQVSVFLIALGLALIIFHQVVLAVLITIGAVAVDYVIGTRKARAYEAKFMLQLPNALLLISSAMAAGRNFVNALEATTPNLADPIKTELITLAGQIGALRVTEAQAFALWAERLPYPELKTISSALSIGNQVGLETYSLLRSLSGSVQDEIRSRAELEALISQVKSTATVISYLPVFFVLLIYLITPKFVTPLFSTVVGGITVLIALGMNIISRRATAGILKRIEA